MNSPGKRAQNQSFTTSVPANCPPRQHQPPCVPVGLPNSPGLNRFTVELGLHEVRRFEYIVDVEPDIQVVAFPDLMFLASEPCDQTSAGPSIRFRPMVPIV